MTDPELGARIFMGVVMTLLAALGTVLIAHAVDQPMTVFGYSLLIFGVAYVFALIGQHFDAVQQHAAQPVPVEAPIRSAAA